MVDGTVDELYERAKELVPDVDKAIEELKKKGECLTTFEALNHLIRKNSREKVGTQWFDGFWLQYTKSRRGNTIGYIISDNEVRMVFFEKPLKSEPKRFKPVKMKVNIIRNLISQTESYEYLKHKISHLTSADLLGMVVPPGAITDKKWYLVGGKIRYIRQVEFERGQKLEKPKPLFEQNKEGDRFCHLKMAVADFNNEQSLCNLTLSDPEILAKVVGVKLLKLIDHYKKIPTEEKKLEKLQNALIGKRILIFGNGSNKHPTEDRTISTPYIGPGKTGFILLYDGVFAKAEKEYADQMNNLDKEMDNAESEDKVEDKKKPSPEKIKNIENDINGLIKKGKATKKTLRTYAEKHKVSTDTVSEIIQKWMKEKKVKLVGNKIVSTKKK